MHSRRRRDISLFFIDFLFVLRSVLGGLVGLYREAGYTKEETKKRLHDYDQVDESDLDEFFEAIWQGN